MDTFWFAFFFTLKLLGIFASFAGLTIAAAYIIEEFIDELWQILIVIAVYIVCISALVGLGIIIF